VFTSALITLKFFLPETPAYLLTSGNIPGYYKSIKTVTGQKLELVEALNISNITEWRKNQINKPQTTFSSLWAKENLKRNLIGTVLINSVCAFNNYLIGYYTKYFPGSFFVNYALIGLADALSIAYVNLLSRYFTKIIYVVNFVLGVTIALSLCFLFF
jgi:hypothetical protein